MPKEPINRTQEIENLYTQHKKNHGGDLKEYLLNRFNEDINYFNHPSWFKLVPCDFPYNLEEGIDHWILWFNPAIKSSYTHEDVDSIIQNYMTNYKTLIKYSQYIYFENDPINRSVLYIRHFHVFFR